MCSSPTSTAPVNYQFPITVLTEEIAPEKSAISSLSSPLWASVIYIFRLLDGPLVEPTAADCWDKSKAFWVFLHHMTFPNDGGDEAQQANEGLRPHVLWSSHSFPYFTLIVNKTKSIHQYCLKCWKSCFTFNFMPFGDGFSWTELLSCSH